MSNRAGLIGINRYRVLGADLRGCVPDLNNVCNFLHRSSSTVLHLTGMRPRSPS
jgi:hypothetical protein